MIVRPFSMYKVLLSSDFLYGCHVLSKVEENMNIFWVIFKLLSPPKLLHSKVAEV